MTRKASLPPATVRRRTPEQRRRTARRQTRTFRATAATPKPAERKARPRRTAPILPRGRPSKGRLLAAALAVAVAALIGFGFADSRFYVESAEIEGVQYSPLEQIQRQADVDGYSIFWVNGRAAAQRIESLPYVKRAIVRTMLPNRVRIEVQERTPVAVWRVNGQDLWVDLDGFPMPVANPELALPVFVDLDGSSVTADGSADQQIVNGVHQLREKFPEIGEFAYDRFNGLQFRLPEGALVLLGKPENLAQRLEELLVLESSLASLGQMPLEIDWRFTDGYTLKLP